MIAIYIHIPFCKQACHYCNFHFSTNQIGKPLFVKALLNEIDLRKHEFQDQEIASIYFGGGTPSLLNESELGEIFQRLKSTFNISPQAEITLEANPGTFEKDRFKAFRAAGVTRLSIGVQSFNDAHLKALGRVHNSAQAMAAIEEAKSAFETFNLDVMYALPGQTLAQLGQDIDTALSFKPPHISIYHLTIEPNTLFAKHPPVLPQEDDAYAMMDLITERTGQAGLQRYEVSAYALPGHRCWHNLNYWQFGDYLGIGAGAHSKLSFAHRVTRQIRYRDPQLYMTNALKGEPATQHEEVAREDLPFEYMLNALRLKEGFSLTDYMARTGLAMTSIQKALAQEESKGLIQRDLNRVWPTERGFDFLSDLQEIFLADR
jgi:oxygen-independent coproporphyrinogen-3 oxidase